jgi:heptaprenyl diphosphate synthase
MEKVVLVQDPLHDYATRFIEVIYNRYGYRAVCFFTDSKRRAVEEGSHAVLRSNAVAERVDVRRQDLPAFADRVKARHEPVAVIPYGEDCLNTAIELGAMLGLVWNDLEVVRRFRDKAALKEHVRRVDPSVRLNASARVRGVDDVFRRGSPTFERFVLKPNDGFGNRGVGIFDASASRRQVAAFFEQAGGAALTLEEYVGGIEYFVNGQTDARGDAHVYAVFRYERVAANGRENLDYRTDLVHRSDPVFATLEAYATRVVRATGLVRSPFHLEAKVDGAGPCLIEIAARLPGLGNAFVCDAAHGGALDVFGLAAHHYLTEADYGPIALRWDSYDARDRRYVHGIAKGGALACDDRVIHEVEQLPSFDGWAKKPIASQREPATVDCMSMPWSLVLSAPVGTNLEADEAAARWLLDRPSSPLSPRTFATRALRYATRAGRRANWQMEHLRSALSAPGRREAQRRIVGFLQREGVWPRRADARSQLAPAQVAIAAQMLEWARSYLTQPHPMLGRSGAVCPFVSRTIAADQFLIVVHDEVEASEEELRAVILAEAHRFRRRYAAERYHAAASLLILLPDVPDSALHLIDSLHDEIKTGLMKRGIMTASMHPRSTRPARWNPDFAVLRAPVPCMAVRHMHVQDIVFLGHNREAFLTYKARFGALYAQQKVSNELGCVDLFEAAKARLGVP